MKTELRNTAMVVMCSLVLAACGSGDDKSAADAKDDAMSSAKQAMDDAKGAMDDAKGAMDDAKDAMGDAKDAMADAGKDAMGAAKDAMGDAKDAMGNAKDAMGDAKDAMANAGKDAMNTATDMAKDAMGGAADDGDPCTLVIEAGDTLAYNINSMSAPASCGDITVTLNHTGNMPAAAMGHNWVLTTATDINALGMAGTQAGAQADYVPADDDTIIAATKVIGGGESTSVTFSTEGMQAGTDYTYVCTFPGHWAVMKGTFTLTN